MNGSANHYEEQREWWQERGYCLYPILQEETVNIAGAIAMHAMLRHAPSMTP